MLKALIPDLNTERASATRLPAENHETVALNWSTVQWCVFKSVIKAMLNT